MKPIPVTTSGSLGHEPFLCNDVLTPTTLRNITQILESDECIKNIETFEKTGEVEVQKRTLRSSTATTKRSGNTFLNLDFKSWQGGTTTIITPTKSQEEIVDSTESSLPESVVHTNQRSVMQTRSSNKVICPIRNNNNNATKMSDKPKRKGNTGGGRKPAMGGVPEEALTTEERERLRVRRLRNKEAAARCRKRRVDQTNTLQEEVDAWQSKKQALENEIRKLQRQRDELQFVLENHCNSVDCKLIGVSYPNQIQEQKNQSVHYIAIKSEPVIVEPADAPYTFPDRLTVAEDLSCNSTQMTTDPKPKRPITLGFEIPSTFTVVKKEVEGVAIETPSSIIPSLNLDALVNTGLTPTATPVTFHGTILSTPTLNTPTIPTCSNQQRSQEPSEYTSTPEGMSLVSL